MVTVRRQDSARAGSRVCLFCRQVALPEIVSLRSVVAFFMKNSYLDELLKTCGLWELEAALAKVNKKLWEELITYFP
jgi:hypothetical protein